MSRRQTEIALIVALFAGLASLPLPWVTYTRPAKLEEVLLNNGEPAEVKVVVTALNGQYPRRLPLWFFPGLAILSCVLQLRTGSDRGAVWGMVGRVTWFTAALWILFAFDLLTMIDQWTLGLGTLLGFISAVIPVACLATPDWIER